MFRLIARHRQTGPSRTRSKSRVAAPARGAQLAEPLEGRRLLSAAAILADIRPGAGGSSPDRFLQVGSALYFTADDGAHGAELWRTDGTPGGTYMVKDIDRGAAGSGPDWLADVGGTLYFAANDGLHGTELWRSDGTEAGTQLVSDVEPGPAGSGLRELTGVGSTLYFARDDAMQLWASDGTAAGTRLLKVLTGRKVLTPYSFRAAGGSLYFVATSPDANYALWRSDGTAGGTAALLTSPVAIGNLTPAGDALYATGNWGRQLWRTDGTPEGTSLVRYIREDQEVTSSRMSSGNFAYINGTLYFAGDDGQGGTGLWRSDGTPEGTYVLKDVAPASIAEANGTVYFAGATSSDFLGNPANAELWATDGTPEGTRPVREINAESGPYSGPEGSDPSGFAEFGGTTVFLADDGSGTALWRTDGTAAGTGRVDAGVGIPSFLAPLNGHLVLAGQASPYGRELFALDSLATDAPPPSSGGGGGTAPAPDGPDLVGALRGKLKGGLVAGTRASVTLKVTNAGSRKASGMLSARLYLARGAGASVPSGRPIAVLAARQVSLGPGQSVRLPASFAYPAYLRPGTYALLARINPDRKVRERDYANDAAGGIAPVTVQGPAVDLKLALASAPGRVAGGSEVRLRVRVRNLGTVRAAGRGTLRLYESMDRASPGRLLGTAPLAVTLGPKQSAVFNVTVAVQAGSIESSPAAYLYAVFRAKTKPADADRANDGAFSASAVKFG